MIKKITIFLSFIVGGFLHSQESEYYGRVGINTETPQATLDIVGRPTDPNAVDGILIPRIKLSDLIEKQNYGIKERGTLIYLIGAFEKIDWNLINNKLPFENIKSMKEKGFGDFFYWWTGEQWEPFGNLILIDKTATIIGETTVFKYNIYTSGENKGVLLLDTHPTFSNNSNTVGQMYMNTETNTLYIWNGKEWFYPAK